MKKGLLETKKKKKSGHSLATQASGRQFLFLTLGIILFVSLATNQGEFHDKREDSRRVLKSGSTNGVIVNESKLLYGLSERRARELLRHRHLLSEYQQLQLEMRLLDTSFAKLNGSGELNSSSRIGAPEKETIFVSIASYRDDECPKTVLDMFSQALNPLRLFLGIIEQNEPEDVGCIPLEYYEEDCAGYPAKFGGFCPLNNIRIRRVLPFEARGPTFGRWVAGMMFQDEKYFMMIDSHNRFLKQWDQKLIDMYQLIPAGSKGVFSHYPNTWKNDTKLQEKDQGMLMVMCRCFFKYPEMGYPTLGTRPMKVSKRPRLQPYAAAGFLFADGALIREVPFDPYLDYLFDGEEILYSVRMWTHGWDMYAPTESVLFHYYRREKAHRVWSVKKEGVPIPWTPIQKISQKRVQYILRTTNNRTTLPLVPRNLATDQKIPREDRIRFARIYKELDLYGLGKVRSLPSYWKFARIDPVKREENQEYCDSLETWWWQDLLEKLGL